jgi:hypothetical protein
MGGLANRARQSKIVKLVTSFFVKRKDRHKIVDMAALDAELWHPSMSFLFRKSGQLPDPAHGLASFMGGLRRG